MTLSKEELEEMDKAFERVFNYDPDDEEVDAKYDENFDDEVMEMLDQKFKK